MPWGDGIDRIHSFSLTDFNTFDYCPFRFFVFHHLQKKYELSDSSPQLALGTLLDESIKLFHKANAYGCEPDYLANIVRGALNHIKEKVVKEGENSFHGKHLKFLDDQTLEKAINIFQDYYLGLDKKINRSLGEVGFCEWVIDSEDGKFKLWGGPDCFEMGEDGIPEVCDYKYREDIEKGKDQMDMDLMPKIYMLLALNCLLSKGFKKARFVVRFWQDPKDHSYYEEFDVAQVSQFEELFKLKIQKILSTTQISFCDKPFCVVCNSAKKDEYLVKLSKMGFQIEA